MSTKEPVLIIGAGGHAKVLIDILRQENKLEIAGLIGQSDEVGQTVLDVPVIGDESSLPALLASGVSALITAIGDNHKRLALATQAKALGFTLVNAISPRACVSSYARLAQGIAIMPGAIINAAACIEENVIVNSNASIDHDCRIRAYSHVAPGCALAGGVTVGKGVFIGTGASVIPGISIGDWSIVGAGSVVIRDLPDHAVAYGVPATVWRFAYE